MLIFFQDLIDSTINGNIDTNIKHQRLDSIPQWLGQLTTSSDPIRVKLLCGADLLESFRRPGLWKEEDVSTCIMKKSK